MDQGVVVLKKSGCFSLGPTLFCGQCFRFSMPDEKSYLVMAKGDALLVRETADAYHFLCSREVFLKIWQDYFDLKRDYQKIQQKLLQNDPVLQEAIAFAPGIHILQQDFFECLLSFIISQNNRIGKIKNIVKAVSRAYGEPLSLPTGEEDFSFPKPEALLDVLEEDYRKLGAGFRAPYLCDAVKRVASLEITAEALQKLDTNAARSLLMEIKGVGPKVADCVLLFSLGRTEAFPVDVWVKRVMEYFYFSGREVPVREIQAFASTQFGRYAGFAQQYLFYLARERKLGQPKKPARSEKK